MFKFTIKMVMPAFRACFGSVRHKHSYQKLYNKLDDRFSPEITSVIKTGEYTKHAEVFQQDDVEKAMDVLLEIIDVLTSPKYSRKFEDLRKWMADMYLYTLVPGKKFSLLGAVLCYREMEEPEKLTESNIHLSHILGWCVEMLLASCDIVDDMLDKSNLRRGLPCWYKHNNINEDAILDSYLMDSAIHILLAHYFENHTCQHPAQKFFAEYIHSICTAQMIEALGRPNGKPNFEYFTSQRWYEFSYLIGSRFLQSIELSAYLANVYDPILLNKLRYVASEIGIVYNAQNDYLDFSCDQKETGKESVDISSGKLSFYAVEAWKRANPEQKKVIQHYYGVPGPESNAIVRQLFNEMKITQLFQEYEERKIKKIFKDIEELPDRLPKNFLYTFTKGVYKRTR